MINIGFIASQNYDLDITILINLVLIINIILTIIVLFKSK